MVGGDAMTLTARPETITTEQLLALPDDGKERWLISGELREKEMTRRNFGHSRVEAKIAYLLRRWMEGRPGPRGAVVVGEAGVRLRRNPDTTVGVDVAYVSAETADGVRHEDGFVDGVPVLVVEILSPSDKQEEIEEKLKSYLAAGVKLVWIVAPTFRTITVYRGDSEPELFNATQSISADPHLPGFNVAVADVFSR
jgi:Uma2 family endonuclease